MINKCRRRVFRLQPIKKSFPFNLCVILFAGEIGHFVKTRKIIDQYEIFIALTVKISNQAAADKTRRPSNNNPICILKA
jgi:hypothetical protein